MSVRRPAPPPLASPREQYVARRPTTANTRNRLVATHLLASTTMDSIFATSQLMSGRGDTPVTSREQSTIPLLKLNHDCCLPSRPTSARPPVRPQSAKSTRSSLSRASGAIISSSAVPKTRSVSISDHMHVARSSVQGKGKSKVKEYVSCRSRTNFTEEHQRSPVYFIQTEAAAQEAEKENGQFLFLTVESWIARLQFDELLRYRPLTYVLNFNESLRSMQNLQAEHISQEEQEASFHTYERTVNRHTQIEYFTAKRRNQYKTGTVALTGADANRFSILRERQRKTGFPLPISYQKHFGAAGVSHQHRHSYHPIAIVISAPKTPGVRCMVVGELRHTISGKLNNHRLLRPNLTTLTEDLQRREERERVDVNPAASLRLMRRMQQVATAQKRRYQSTANSEGDLEEAMQTILAMADEAEEDDHDKEEADRMRQIMKFALLGGDPTADPSRKRRVGYLPPEFHESMVSKVVSDGAPLRPTLASGEPTGTAGHTAQTHAAKSDESFAHYDDCYVTPKYLVVYRSQQNFTNEKEYRVQSIIQRRHAAGAAEAAQALPESDLKVLELTLQWHVPISEIHLSVQKPINQRRLVVHSETLSEEAQEEVPLPLFLRLLGNGVASVDVSHPASENAVSRADAVVDYRHSFAFSNK